MNMVAVIGKLGSASCAAHCPGVDFARRQTCARRRVTCRASAQVETSARDVEVRSSPTSKYNEIARFMVKNYYLDGDGVELPGGQRRRLEGDQAADLKRRYAGSPRRQAAVLVAEQNGQIGGCAAVVVTPFESNGRPDMSLDSTVNVDEAAAPVLGNLAVAQGLRRKGIGRKIVNNAEQMCKDWGYEEIWLGVESSNGKARRLYEKLGYKQQFTLKESTVKVVDGSIEEVMSRNVYMKKSLRGGIAGLVDNAPWGRMALLLASAAAIAASSRDAVLTELVNSMLMNRFG